MIYYEHKWGKWAYRLHYYWMILQIKLPPLFAKSELVDHALNRIFLFNVLRLIVIQHLHQSELWMEYLSISLSYVYIFVFNSGDMAFVAKISPHSLSAAEPLFSSPRDIHLSPSISLHKLTRTLIISAESFDSCQIEFSVKSRIFHKSEQWEWFLMRVGTATVFHFKVHFNNIGPWKFPATGTLPLKGWLHKSIDKIDGWNFTPFTTFFI